MYAHVHERFHTKEETGSLVQATYWKMLHRLLLLCTDVGAKIHYNYYFRKDEGVPGGSSG